MQQPHADPGGPLAISGLRDQQFRFNPMLRLYPTQPSFVARSLRKQLRSDALGEPQVRRVAREAMQAQEELGDPGRATTDADVVPEARRLFLRDAARHNRTRR